MNAMECHGSALVLGTYMCVVEGWGDLMRNTISVFDLSSLPRLTHISIVTSNVPSFRYGFSVTKISEMKLLLYGGFCSGGYSTLSPLYHSFYIGTRRIKLSFPLTL